jgi:hypothetical protein
MTVARGELKLLYEEGARQLAKLVAARTRWSTNNAIRSRIPAGGVLSGKSTEPETTNQRECRICGAPVGLRGGRAVYCSDHPLDEQRRFRRLLKEVTSEAIAKQSLGI